MQTANKLALIAQANQKPIKKQLDSYQLFEKKKSWGSHQYVRYVKEKCKEFALQGYGSCKITIDKTSDLFMMDEGRNSCYSTTFVCQLLNQEGFKFDDEFYCDHYDAFSSTLIWDSKSPQSPNNIGMCWK